MKSFSDSIKSVIFVAIVLALGIMSAIRLMEIQVVGDDDIVDFKDNGVSSFVYTKNTRATRGEIVDYSGNLIIGNSTSTDIIIQKAFFPDDNKEGNAVLLKAYNELKSRGYTVEQNIPVSASQPYVYVEGDTDKLKSELNLNVYATAENCIDKLISDYKISDNYSDAEKRIIAGLRYEMTLKDFSYSNDFLLAENVDADTVIDMKELSNILRGVNAIESAERNIIQGNVLPHEIGTIGPIYAEQYDELKEKGYALNDVVGKNGIELAMEKELRGLNGSQKITIQNDTITDVETIEEANSGSTVKLTINSTYQIRLQSILDNFIANFQSINKKPELRNVNVQCGAIVVLEAKTGRLRGAATAPTYNLLDYKEDYDLIRDAANSPLVNRATDGTYRPGSTFKTITATAGLNEGIITGGTTFTCNRKYHYIDTDYQCTGYHNDIAVTRALEVSCNIFFYELSQRLTIDNITKYAELYGLGQHTGLETGDAAGYLANPETFAANGQNWYVGYVLQAGIGNIDCGMTPLQMACVANTIANDGVRYQPYLVDGLYEYGTDNLIMQTMPTIAEQIQLNYDYVYDYIEQGMIAASRSMPVQYSLSNLGFDVAIKTGTPQVGNNNEQNSFFIGYAPADNPEIAFAGVIEGGEYSKYMIRDIILAYQECYGLNGVGPTVTLEGTDTVTNTETGTGTDITGVTDQTSTTAVQTPQDNNVTAPEDTSAPPPEQQITEPVPENTQASEPASEAPDMSSPDQPDVTMPPVTPESNEPDNPDQNE